MRGGGGEKLNGGSRTGQTFVGGSIENISRREKKWRISGTAAVDVRENASRIATATPRQSLLFSCVVITPRSSIKTDTNRNFLPNPSSNQPNHPTTISPNETRSQLPPPHRQKNTTNRSRNFPNHEIKDFELPALPSRNPRLGDNDLSENPPPPPKLKIRCRDCVVPEQESLDWARRAWRGVCC